MKALLTLIAFSAILISLVAGVQVEVAKANPFPTYPVISIESPTNKTYTANSLLLNVTLVTKWDGSYFTSENRIVNYCIDGKESIQITQTEYKFDAEKQASLLSGSAVLTDLTEGTHNLRVNAEYHYDNGKQVFVSNSSVNFTIDPNYSPSLSPSPSPTLISTASPNPTVSPKSSTQQPPSSPTSIPPDNNEVGVNNLPLILGAIALAILVTAVVVVLLIKRRSLTK